MHLNFRLGNRTGRVSAPPVPPDDLKEGPLVALH